MPAQVLSYLRLARKRDWTPNELAQFYRVEGALVQAGVPVETEKGVTDEGDPWFVFCRRDDGEVFIHFARIEGGYIAVGAALERVVRGRNFPALVDEMLATQAFTVARAHKHSGVFIHPAALLLALVGGAFFHSSQAKAEGVFREARTDPRRPDGPFFIGGAPAPLIDAAEATAIFSVLLDSPAGSAGAALQHVATAVDVRSVDIATLIGLPAAGEPMASAAAPFLASASESAPVSQAPMDAGVLSPAYLPVRGPAAFDAYPAIPLDHGLEHGSNPSLPAFATTAGSAQLTPPNAAMLISLQSSQASAALEAAKLAGSAQVQPAAPPFVSDPALMGFLKLGLHITVVTAGTGTAGLSDRHDVDGPGGQHPDDVSAGPHDTVDVGGAPAQGPAAPEAPPPPAHPVALSANSPQVTAAIQHFSAEVGALDLANAAHGIVLYDGALFTAGGGIPSLDSVTFTFSDGSYVSLVGTALEIQHLHLV